MAMVRAAFGFFLKLALKFAGLAYMYANVFSFDVFVGFENGSSFHPSLGTCLGFRQNPSRSENRWLGLWDGGFFFCRSENRSVGLRLRFADVSRCGLSGMGCGGWAVLDKNLGCGGRVMGVLGLGVGWGRRWSVVEGVERRERRGTGWSKRGEEVRGGGREEGGKERSRGLGREGERRGGVGEGKRKRGGGGEGGSRNGVGERRRGREGKGGVKGKVGEKRMEDEWLGGGDGGKGGAEEEKKEGGGERYGKGEGIGGQGREGGEEGQGKCEEKGSKTGEGRGMIEE
ncbi:hypothetical protein Tco_1446968 [Tanacetum coccineum]